MKINLGSHNKNIGEEHINVDILKLPNVDLHCDLTYLPFYFRVLNKDRFRSKLNNEEKLLADYDTFNLNNEMVDEIIMEEVLEHLSFRDCIPVLREIYRILVKGGVLKIQVPDCGKAMEYYVNNQICTCCSHKPLNEKEAKGKKDCFICQGNGKIHPDRWLYSFLGAQKHIPGDIHKNIFTFERLESQLNQINFSKVNIKRDKYEWKLIAECIK